LDRVREIAGDHPFEVIGSVGGSDLIFEISGNTGFSYTVAELQDAWRTSLGKILEP
jgi:hypothetical protein